MEKNIDALFSRIIDTYCELRNINKLPGIDITLTDNIYSECLQKNLDCFKESIENQKEWVNSLNGTIIYPENRLEKFGILINLSYIKKCFEENNINWIGTLCHELTHVLDYIRAMELRDINFIEEFTKEDDYHLFGYWTEFNARRYGHYLLRYYTLGDMIKSEESLKDILKREMPFQINYLASCFQENHNQIYSTIQFLGRLKVWKDLFPDYFNKTTLHKILYENEWIEKLYWYFDDKDSIEKAIDTLDNINEILKGYYS